MSAPLIRIEHLFKSYPLGEEQVEVLRDINLEIRAGEYVSLMGASGSGKSTLMNILGCLDRPTRGNYYLEGEEMGRASGNRRAAVRNRKIGFVFQSFNLLARTSALDNVILPLEYTASDLPMRRRREMGMEALRKLNIDNRADHHPSQLSGGQQQRVAIARALINNPPIIFADEPTGNLDSRTSVEVMETFARLNEQNITVILVTHSDEIAGMSKRVIHLKDGQIIPGVYNQK